jgi:type IX secretion system PorP/SprF family membrane protein
MRKFSILLLSIPLLFTAAKAQQDAQYTMFMFNRQAINPAYAGALEATNITMLGRSQWVGIEGAPRTAVVSANGYLAALHGGLGGHVIADDIGPLSTLGVKAAYAFHLNIGSTKLQIGAQGGIYQKSLNGDWKYQQDITGVDPTLPLGKTAVMLPDLDAGIYWHKPLPNKQGNAQPHDRFFLGGNVNHILEPTFDGVLAADVGGKTTLTRDIFGMAGFTFDLDRDRGVYLAPSVQYRMAGPLKQFDINANLYLSPMVFGVSHRWKDSFSGIIGFNATSDLFMAYSYDYTISRLSGFTTGSHELIISYTFPSKRKVIPGLEDTRDSGGRL